MTPIYGREALRRLCEEQEVTQEPDRKPTLLEQIPADVPMEDATITFWNGERFVAYEKWRAAAPVAIEKRPARETTGTEESDAEKQPSRKSASQESLW